VSEQLFTAITEARNIEEKSFSTFDVNGTGIVICRFRDEYFAIENRCSHARATFNEGRMRGYRIICPKHGYRIICPKHGAIFDIRDGSCAGAPATKPIRSFPLRIVDGMIEVDLTTAN